MASKHSSPPTARWAWALGGLALVLLTVVCFVLSPEQIIAVGGMQAKTFQIRASLLTDARWRLVQLLLAALACSWLMTGVWLSNVVQLGRWVKLYFAQSLTELNSGCQSLLLLLQTMPVLMRSAFGLLGVALLGQWVWAMLRLPLTYDEIWTFLNFSSRGPFISLAYYPAPNNHVLYSIVSSLSVAVVPSSVIGMRLPSVVASAMTYGLLSVLLLRHTKSASATLGALLLYNCFYSVFFYAFLGRGYSLLSLTFIGSLGASLELMSAESRYRRLAWLGFVFFSVAGLFTIPTFLYAVTTLGLLLALNALGIGHCPKAVRWGPLFSASAIVAGLTLLLYGPILLANGLGAIIGNKYVASISRSEVLAFLPSHIRETKDRFFGSALLPVLLLLLAMLGLVLSLRGRSVKLVNGLWLFFLTPFVFMLVQAVIPFSRTWVYLAVVATLLAAMGLAGLLQLVQRPVFSGIVVAALAALWGYEAQQQINRFAQENISYFSFNNAFAALRPGIPLVIDSDNADVLLEYQHRVAGLSYRPLRGALLKQNLPNRILLVHDKLANAAEQWLAGPRGTTEFLYNDAVVSVQLVSQPRRSHQFP